MIVHMKGWAAIGVLAFVILLPTEAFAWGLVTHLQIGRTILNECKDLLAVYAPAVIHFPMVYLYGSIAPDRFLAKNLKTYKEHTHGWDRAFNMLQHAGTDDLKAFSLGYLSHLAADVIAHNLFVPMKIMERPGVAGRRHAYWELKFEHYQPKEAWDLADEVDRRVEKSLFDSFMEMFQSPSLLSFNANMALSDRIFKVMGSHRTRKWVSRFELGSDSVMDRGEVEVYMDLALDCVYSLLKERERSHVTAADPRGGSRIGHARMLSKAVVRTAARAAAPDSVRKAFGTEMSRLLDDAATVLPEHTPVGVSAKHYEQLKTEATAPLPKTPKKKTKGK
jgi:hypothetical protein